MCVRGGARSAHARAATAAAHPPPAARLPLSSQVEGEAFARSIGAELFLETSAKTRENVDLLLPRLADIYARRRGAAGIPLGRLAPAPPAGPAKRSCSVA